MVRARREERRALLDALGHCAASCSQLLDMVGFRLSGDCLLRHNCEAPVVASTLHTGLVLPECKARPTRSDGLTYLEGLMVSAKANAIAHGFKAPAPRRLGT
jgi:hypothetical protein